MAYEAEGRRLAGELRERYGRLLEARLGHPIVLVFERGEWTVPSSFIFKFGYAGSGPDCFHSFLAESGLDVAKSAVESGQPGAVLEAPGHDARISAFVVGDDGEVRRTGSKALLDRERARTEHERGVATMDRGDFRGATRSLAGFARRS